MHTYAHLFIHIPVSVASLFVNKWPLTLDAFTRRKPGVSHAGIISVSGVSVVSIHGASRYVGPTQAYTHIQTSSEMYLVRSD